MPDNSQVNRNGVQDKCSSYPVRPGEANCIYYMRTGMCGYGINCRFNHPYVGQVGQDGGELPQRIGQPDCAYFLKTGTCKYGSTCKYHHPRVLFNMLGLPERPGEPNCIYYLRTGMCGYGITCRFNHPYVGQVGQDGGELPERIGQPDCGYFLKTGTCKYGLTCKYHHPRVLLNMLGLPMRQEEKSCPYYMRTGLCKFGITCEFDHPQPLSAETVLSVAEPPQYGSTGLSSVNSSGLPYANGFPAWSLPKGPHQWPPSQGPQTYMPVVLSPSQGIVPAQGWNTYVGSLSPISSPSVYGESGFNGHHPREKIAQSAISSLGPLGLPLRPGKGVCSYYNTYGLCKYGATCKYDHPLVGYPYNYHLSLPTLPIPDPSFFPYRLNSSTVHLSEIFPSKSSSTVPDWIHKHEVASEKSLKSNSTPEDSLERAVSPSQSLAASSKNLHGQSD